MARSEGAKLLREALEKRGLSQADLAEKLRVKRSTVHRWLNGSRPEPPLREALKLVIGIPEDAWLSAADRRAIQHAQDLARSA